MKKWIYNVLIILFVAVFLFAAYKLGTILWGYYQNRQLQSEIQDIFHSEGGTDKTDGDKEESESRTETIEKDPFQIIQEINSDVKAWLEIPGADVDHPVVQAEDNEYYLNRDFYKKYRYAGTLYFDYRNNLEGSFQNLIIYGHHMSDGSMFGKLGDFLKKDFYEKNKTFTMITEDTVYECEIFAVYQCLTDFPYAQPVLFNEEYYTEYVQMCREASIYDTGTQISPGDLLLTLSTCDLRYDKEKGRIVIQAKLTPVAARTEK